MLGSGPLESISMGVALRRAIKRSAGRLVPLDTRLTVGEPASRRAFSCFAWCRLRGDAEMAARQVPAGLLAVIAIATLPAGLRWPVTLAYADTTSLANVPAAGNLVRPTIDDSCRQAVAQQ